MRKWIGVAVAVVAIGVQAAGKEAKEEKEITFEKAESWYESGKCAYSASDTGLTHRQLVLLFLNDVLRGTTGHDSIVNQMVGNMAIFKVGRNPDSELVKLYQYAARFDVKKQIGKDADAMDTQLKGLIKTVEAKKDSQEVMAVAFFLVCESYKMLAGMNYYFAKDLQEYFKDLNARILNANMNRLQPILEGE
ncbi:hypothetical protein [Azotobacter beijerinckii]|uniref:hypothetical protein n=1 Tax=Azotobacter beijerinckii TaxID=170623 RepID=UPI002955601F|nr:hypothetical protein [Azotobacter beijerinckii]MDV7210148.1 hypothetical protein [Azotobacter beijerinckii]